MGLSWGALGCSRAWAVLGEGVALRESGVPDSGRGLLWPCLDLMRSRHVIKQLLTKRAASSCPSRREADSPDAAPSPWGAALTG